MPRDLVPTPYKPGGSERENSVFMLFIKEETGSLSNAGGFEMI